MTNKVTSEAYQLDAVEWLRQIYRERKRKNANYSVRSLAKSLCMSCGRLSELLSRKRQLTQKTASRIAEHLDLRPDEFQKFVDLAKPSKKKVSSAPAAQQTPKVPDAYFTLSEDVYALIADWQHFAFLTLMHTLDFRVDTRWIAQRLGISALDVRATIERLERVGLIEFRDGTYVRTSKNVATTNDIPSSALRESHRQCLQQAIDTLESVEVDKRDISSVSLAIDPRKLPEAKARIKRFRRELADFLESGDQREVYNFNLQLVPVSK